MKFWATHSDSFTFMVLILQHLETQSRRSQIEGDSLSYNSKTNGVLPLFHTHKFTQFDWLKLGLPRMTHQVYKLIIFQAALRKLRGIERFSNDRRKTKTKAIIPTNHNRNKQHDELITIPSNYL